MASFAEPYEMSDAIFSHKKALWKPVAGLIGAHRPGDYHLAKFLGSTADQEVSKLVPRLEQLEQPTVKQPRRDACGLFCTALMASSVRNLKFIMGPVSANRYLLDKRVFIIYRLNRYIDLWKSNLDVSPGETGHSNSEVASMLTAKMLLDALSKFQTS